MKGLKKLSDKTRNTQVQLYYSPSTDTVCDTPKNGYYLLTTLIAFHSPAEIKSTVERFMRY